MPQYDTYFAGEDLADNKVFVIDVDGPFETTGPTEAAQLVAERDPAVYIPGELVLVREHDSAQGDAYLYRIEAPTTATVVQVDPGAPDA